MTCDFAGRPAAAWVAGALMLSGCAVRPTAEAAPPILSMPLQASERCSLYVLPDAPTQADLELGYVTRGAQILECEGKRRLAVETAEAQAALSKTGAHAKGR